MVQLSIAPTIQPAVLLQVKLAGTALDTRTYDNGGRLSTSAYSNGITTTWSYRNDNLVTSINATSPAGTPNDSKVANLAYTWDANKNKLSEVHSGVNATVNGFGFNAADTTYDFEDRLTQWKRANGTENQSWKSDFGRRLAIVHTQRNSDRSHSRSDARAFSDWLGIAELRC